jgi:hypothetical protein
MAARAYEWSTGHIDRSWFVSYVMPMVRSLPVHLRARSSTSSPMDDFD